LNTPILGIQYLRGVAALMVVWHHAFNYFGGPPSNFGATGVDIFFVVSGFIMAHSTRHFEPAGSRVRQAAEFLLRRLIRVVPLYWIALLWMYKRGGDPIHLLAMDFVFLPRWNATDRMVAPQFTPGWTINYEMFFYALFAASMLVGKMRFALLGAVLLTLVCLAGLSPTSPAGLFLTSSVLVEFLFGVGVYFFAHRPMPVRGWMLWVLASLCLRAMWDSPPVPRGFYVGPLAAVLVWAVVLVTRRIEMPRLRAIGDASYSIYLFHIASFGISLRLCDALHLGQRGLPGLILGITLQMVIATGVGLAIHRFIERPLLRAMHRSAGAVPAA
jgi:exopolysaccharide production protein ExoZ